ncbi:hypothetical protein [Nostoc sp.]|uniref:hypothetical protein n=1 Tax=Nostoc sp. TaxID=1180 RepID=UPI002FFB15A3
MLVSLDLQRTSEPKSEDAPNNFYQSVPEDNRVEGGFGNLVVPSVSDWLDKNLLLQWGAIAGTLALAFLAVQAFKKEG